jgi:hypothetical protein
VLVSDNQVRAGGARRGPHPGRGGVRRGPPLGHDPRSRRRRHWADVRISGAGSFSRAWSESTNCSPHPACRGVKHSSGEHWPPM